MERIKRRTCAAWALAIVSAAMLAERLLGRRAWGISGEPGLWSGDVNSSHNSQFVADPYSFSHLTHGILLYGLAWLVAQRMPLRVRALLALALESAWEVFENTDFIINRYRTATISLHYYGDSIVNSMGDVGFCMVGFALAAILPTRVTVVVALLLEAGLAFWIRDSLMLNVLMLLWPIAAVKGWQAG